MTAKAKIDKLIKTFPVKQATKDMKNVPNKKKNETRDPKKGLLSTFII